MTLFISGINRDIHNKDKGKQSITKEKVLKYWKQRKITLITNENEAILLVLSHERKDWGHKPAHRLNNIAPKANVIWKGI